MESFSKEKIKNFLFSYCEENGCQPSVREVAQAVNLSKSVVQRHLFKMAESGLVVKGKNGYGSKEFSSREKEGVNIPIVGSVACGQLSFAQENIEGFVSFPPAYLSGGEFFFLKANGLSMVNAGIENGDLVLIKRQQTAENGEIVVALIEDEATLKRFYKDEKNKQFILHAENETFQDIVTSELNIQGVAVKIVKNLK